MAGTFETPSARSSASRPPDAFLDALEAEVERSPESELEAGPPLGAANETSIALLAPPLTR